MKKLLFFPLSISLILINTLLINNAKSSEKTEYNYLERGDTDSFANPPYEQPLNPDLGYYDAPQTDKSDIGFRPLWRFLWSIERKKPSPELKVYTSRIENNDLICEDVKNEKEFNCLANNGSFGVF